MSRLVPAILCLAAALALAAGPAPAEPPAGLALDYHASLAGLTLGAAGVEVGAAGGRYRIAFAAEPAGLVALFSGARLEGRAGGRLDGTAVAPDFYVLSHAEAGRETDRVSLATAGGTVAVTETPPASPPAGGVPPELWPGTADPLSAAVALGAALSAGEGCDRSLTVFDGRRRYDVVVAAGGEAVLPPDPASIFVGPAVLCLVRLVPVAGEFHDFDDAIAPWRRSNDVWQARLWLARPIPEGPMVPVRIDLHRALADVVVRLSGVRPLP